jgi:hypothetical protein
MNHYPETATTYGDRRARFGLVIQARWEREEESAVQVAWAKELPYRLAAYATGKCSAAGPPRMCRKCFRAKQADSCLFCPIPLFMRIRAICPTSNVLKI